MDMNLMHSLLKLAERFVEAQERQAHALERLAGVPWKGRELMNSHELMNGHSVTPTPYAPHGLSPYPSYTGNEVRG
jgi:hypothetical protein